jgi:hypothetical protein
VGHIGQLGPNWVINLGVFVPLLSLSCSLDRLCEFVVYISSRFVLG